MAPDQKLFSVGMLQSAERKKTGEQLTNFGNFVNSGWVNGRFHIPENHLMMLLTRHAMLLVGFQAKSMPILKDMAIQPLGLSSITKPEIGREKLQNKKIGSGFGGGLAVFRWPIRQTSAGDKRHGSGFGRSQQIGSSHTGILQCCDVSCFAVFFR